MRFGPFVALLVFAALPAFAAEPVYPQAAWSRVAPEQAGWPAARLADIDRQARDLRPTGVMIVHDGQVLAAWGDVARKVNVRSVRKSLLSALYGIGVAEGRVDLALTLADLGIDDREPGLTDAEKRATVRDLLMARSGVYHPAAYETRDMTTSRPARGSSEPGERWWYNNWDFNALGVIYARLHDGEGVAEAFERRIARPIGMEDFQARLDGRLAMEAASDHPAYVLRLSARDLARFGLLYLNRGRWADRQIVPASWIEEATRSWSSTDRGGLGYGYMWWTLPATVGGQEIGAGGFLASGYGGQFIAVLPRHRLVVAQTVDPADNREGVRTRDFLTLVGRIVGARAAEP